MTVTTPTVPAPAAPLTAADFVRRHAGERVELIDGLLVPTMPAGSRHGQLCSRLDRLLGGHVEAHGLGLFCSNDTFVLTQRDPDRVRGGDLVFWSKARWAGGKAPDGLIEAAPDLVIEVKSPTDRWAEVTAKAAEYLLGGVGVVVVVDPKTETATAHRADEFHQTFHNGDEFTLPDVLPGFAVPVARFFE